MPPKIPLPEISAVLLADAHKVGSTHKLDCYGLFSRVGVWSVPAPREFSVCFRAEDVRAGNYRITAWLRGLNGRATRTGYFDLLVEEDTKQLIAAQRVGVKISQCGQLAFGLSIARSGRTNLRRISWADFVAHQLDWPVFPTGRKLAEALANPHSLKATRAEVGCRNCGSTYLFEVHLDPEGALSRGAQRFPEDGRFTCPACQTHHNLKDIEGQARSHIVSSLSGEPR